MNAGAREWPGYRMRTVVAVFLLAGIATFGLIPGLGLLLLLAGVSIAVFAIGIDRADRRNAPGGVWLGLAVALLGIFVTFSIHPVLGAALVLAGGGLATGRALLEWLEFPPRRLGQRGGRK
jgi:hypothetical protein